jgi:uncharacterized sporulation protein YeaH/YhbH (DUF444 family)
MKVEEINIAKTLPAPVKTGDSGTPTSDFATAGDKIGREAEPKPKILIPNNMPPAWLINQFRYLFDVSASVDPDLDRYNEILKGKARKELLKFKNPNNMTGIKGGKIVSIPVPIIEIPHFTRGNEGPGSGIGSGDGDTGDPVTAPPQSDEGKAGDQEGGHLKEIWVPMSRSEVAKVLINEYKLPYLQPKGYGGAKEKSIKWNTLSRTGKDMDLIQTVRNVLARTGSEIGDKFDIDTEEGLNAFLDQVVVEEQDKVYVSWNVIEKPQASAVIIYMMDVSGSMTDEQKEWVRTISWYLSTVIQYQFGMARAELRGEKYTEDQFGEGVDEVFITHDAVAHEVSEEEYYTTRESGGTKISSAYRLAEEIIKQRYNPALWNIYIFHFTDGDNWGEDNSSSLEIIERLLGQVNEIGYIQTDSPYGSGEFKSVLDENLTEQYTHLRTGKIEKGDEDNYKKALVDMLGEKKK